MSQAQNIVRLPGSDYGGTLAYASPLIVPGEYLLAFRHYETVKQFHSSKLVLTFQVVTGPHHGALVCRYYAVRSVATRARRKGGQFEYGQKGDFFREFCRVFGAPSRADRASPHRYRNTVVVGLVETVTQGHDQQAIPEGARYSKVKTLLRLDVGH